MSKKTKPVVADIRITDVNKIPPKYFLSDEVTNALRRAIRADVVLSGAPVPPGCRAVMSQNRIKAAAQDIPGVALREVFHGLKKDLPRLIKFYLIGSLAGLIIYLISRWF